LGEGLLEYGFDRAEQTGCSRREGEKGSRRGREGVEKGSRRGRSKLLTQIQIRFCSGSSRRYFFPRRPCDSKFDTCVQAPMYNSPAIHFKVMVVFSLDRPAILTFFGSPLRRCRN